VRQREIINKMLDLYLEEEELKPVKAIAVISFLIVLATLCFGYTIFILSSIRKVFGNHDKQLLASITCLSLSALSTVIIQTSFLIYVIIVFY
jgi:hypothetical protein